MFTYLVISLVVVSLVLLLVLMVARFIQPEMLYAVRHALVQVKSTKTFLDRRVGRTIRPERFPNLLGEDIRFETRDSDEEDVLARVDQLRNLYRVQVLKHLVRGVKKSGKPQICIVELAGMLVNLGRKVELESRFRYSVIDAERLLKFICDEVRSSQGEPPLETVTEVEQWMTEHPISIEQVIEILISAVFGLSYRQRVQVKSQAEENKKEAPVEPSDTNNRSAPVKPDKGGPGTPKEPITPPTLPLPELEPAKTEDGPELVRVFLSYSHRDEKYLKADSLFGALQGLETEGVEFWIDRDITAGDKWDDEIRDQISKCDIAVVLVSQAYLDSPYCKNVEIKRFLEATEKRGLVIFPIMLSKCEHELHEWLKTRQFLPRNGQNIEENYSSRRRRGPLFHDIRQSLRIQIDACRRRKSRKER